MTAVVRDLSNEQTAIEWCTVPVRVELEIDALGRKTGHVLRCEEVQDPLRDEIVIVAAHELRQAPHDVVALRGAEPPFVGVSNDPSARECASPGCGEIPPLRRGLV